MTRAIRRGLTIAGLLAVALLIVWLVTLRPPAPLEVPRPGVTLADVTVINPGSDRRPRQTVRVSGSTIESISDYSAGTDTSPDARRHAGAYVFTPEEAWQAATRRSGASLRVPGLGVLSAGAPADALVFGQDPTADLAALSTLQAVVANGRYYPKPLLERAVARYHDYFSSWIYDRLTMFLLPFFASSQGEQPH